MTRSTEQTRTVAPARVVATLHEGIPVTNLERSAKFYAEVLGLDVLPRPRFPGPGVWFGDGSGGVEIHLSAVASPPTLTRDASPGNRHTAFAVTDLDAFREHLRDLGVPWFEQDGFIQSKQLFINDPDGNTLEFQQVTT